jgi:hypothetical protein
MSISETSLVLSSNLQESGSGDQSTMEEREMKKIVTFLVFLALAATVSVAADEQSGHGPAASDDPRLEFLRSLAGTWVVKSGPEEMPGDSIFEFRVTAGGHAVEEREMAGSPMEMLTLYNMDGKDLVATHFCMLGNQPHMIAAKRVEDHSLSFACDGKPGNTHSHAEEHVHGWTIQRDGDDKLILSGEVIKDGKSSEAPRFVLTRQQETASR